MTPRPYAARGEFVAFMMEHVPPRPEGAEGIRARNLGLPQRIAG